MKMNTKTKVAVTAVLALGLAAHLRGDQTNAVAGAGIKPIMWTNEPSGALPKRFYLYEVDRAHLDTNANQSWLKYQPWALSITRPQNGPWEVKTNTMSGDLRRLIRTNEVLRMPDSKYKLPDAAISNMDRYIRSHMTDHRLSGEYGKIYERSYDTNKLIRIPVTITGLTNLAIPYSILYTFDYNGKIVRVQPKHN